MAIEWKYFIASDEFMQIKERLDESHRAKAAEAEALAKSVGAKHCVRSGARVAGFVFDVAPSNTDWRKPFPIDSGGKAYAPRSTTAFGKDLHARMNAIQFPTFDDWMTHVGLRNWYVLGDGTARGIAMVPPKIEKIGARTLLLVPVSGKQDYTGHALLTPLRSKADYFQMLADQERKDEGNKALVDIVCGTEA
jgi:hypothetical protein